MRKNLLLLFLSLMAVFSASAYDFAMPCNNITIYYNINNDKTSVSVTYGNQGTNSYSGNVVIPDVVTYAGTKYVVNAIGNYAFEGCSNLNRVLIPDAATSIGKRAFADCVKLDRIFLPGSVTKIGEEAFSSCSSISYIEIPGSVEYIGARAFENCSAISQVVMGNSIKSIGTKAFAGCTSLKEIRIGVKQPSEISMGKSVFYDVPTSSCLLIVPRGCTDAFAAAPQWEDFDVVQLNYDFCDIAEDGYFYYVINDDRISVDLTYPDFESDYHYEGDFTVPGSVTHDGVVYEVTGIDEYTFHYCKNLTSISLPNSITSIGNWAFEDCSNLFKITVRTFRPSEIKLGNQVFLNVPKGCTISVPYRSSSAYEEADQWGYFHIEYRSGTLPEQNADDVYIMYERYLLSAGWSVKVIYSLPWIHGVLEIPDYITKRGKYKVTAIEDYAFIERNDLTSVIIPNSVWTIGRQVFDSCQKLNSVVIGNSVYFIDARAFENCSSLTSLKVKVADPGDITLGKNVFNGMDFDNCVLYVPVGSADLYRNAPQWKDFVNIVERNLDASYLPGDANGDGRFTSIDVSLAVAYALGGNPTNGIFEAADTNGDGNVTALDVSKIVSLVLSGSSSTAAKTQGLNILPADAETIDATLIDGDKLLVKIGNLQRYVASQIDIALPEGVEIKSARLTGRNADSHVVACGSLDDGKTRLLVFSSRNANFADSDNLVEIELAGALADADFSVGNVLLVRRDGDGFDEVAACDLFANLGSSAIGAVEVAHGNIVVNGRAYNVGPDAYGKYVVSDLMGRVYEVADGHVNLAPGVYFVNSRKILVK